MKKIAAVSFALLAAAILASPSSSQMSGSGSYDSGTVSVAVTPANSSHASGTSVGGLLSVPVARTAGGSGIITNFGFKSSGGSTGNYVARIWQAKPTNTTCTDNVAFAGNATDDKSLITFAPLSITPLAPASTTGDSNTYAALPSLTLDYKISDQTQNLYVCVVTVLTNTADDGAPVTVYLSGPQN